MGSVQFSTQKIKQVVKIDLITAELGTGRWKRFIWGEVLGKKHTDSSHSKCREYSRHWEQNQQVYRREKRKGWVVFKSYTYCI